MREQALAVTPPAATRALERRLGDQAVVALDPVTRTPRVLARLDGALSGPAAGAADDVALRYVRANLAALGLTETDLDSLRPPVVDTAAGVTTVRWRQAVDGIVAADSELRVNLDADGRVLSVLGSPASGLDANTTPALSAGEAVRIVQDDVGVHRALPRTRGTRSVTYADGTTAALTLYTGRLAWRVTYRAGADAVYDVLVDARTGKLLRRANLVKSVAGRVWDDHPGDGTTHDVNLDAWLTDPNGTRLHGPNAYVHVDADDDDTPEQGEDVTPGTYPFTPVGVCTPWPCSWPTGATDNRKQNAVQAFYFVNRFHEHLETLGFDDFEGGERLLVEASEGADGGAGNNAYMYTPPDGRSPTMHLQLWDRDGRKTNAGDDASIVYHEYTHGLSGRLITDAAGAGALNSPQAGAMGEGWSDFYAKDFLDEPDSPVVDGEIHMGTYAGKSIRKQALDCRPGVASADCAAPAGASAGPGGFTYGDYGKIWFDEAEIHADGEIWAQTLWALRQRLGAAKARTLITAGMRITPPEPSFLDARNAILVAAAAADKPAVWETFAARGMGYYASTTGSEDVSPQQDFEPAALPANGTIDGFVQDAETGVGIAGATVIVGGSPDLTRTTSPSGRYTMNLPRRTYQSVIFSAPGYDRVVKSVTVGAGLVNLGAELRRNWASRSGGATSQGGESNAEQGCGSAAAIDQHLGTTWSAHQPSTPAQMVITLPAAVNVRAFGIDPGEGCLDGWQAAAEIVQVDTAANAGGPWTPAATATFELDDRRRLNPVAAQADGVRYVRVTILSTQGPSLYRDLSEFGVYTLAPPVVTPTPTPTPTATPPTPTATPTNDPTPTPTAPPVSTPGAMPPIPTPNATPAPRPAFTLPSSGKRALKVAARCPAACGIL